MDDPGYQDGAGGADEENVTDAAASTTTSNEQRSRKRSDIWDFIEETLNGAYSCRCCTQAGKTQVWNSKAHTTMRNHLEKYHPREYIGVAISARQTDLLCHGFSRSVKQRVQGEFSKAEADSALVDWIVENSQPFAIVAQPKFISFCAKLEPLYKVPVRQTIRSHVLTKWKLEKTLVRKTLVSEVASSRTSLTTDMWTSAANRGYIIVTLHWIDDEWNLRAVILGFKRVEYPHSGPRLADHLIDVVKAMDSALLASLWAVTTDNAKNNTTMVNSIKEKLPNALQENLQASMPSSARETVIDHQREGPQEVFQVRCLAHVLQLGVKAGLTECPYVDTSIGKVRDVLRKLADSPSLSEALQAVCAALNVPFREPELDCVTRWNSTWGMIVSAIKLKKPIEELLRRIRDRHEGYSDLSIAPDSHLAAEIGEDTWEALGEFCKFLTPVKAATTMMSGKNYPTFGMAVVVYELISMHTNKSIEEATSQYTADFATAFQNKLEDYSDIVNNREAKIAAVLDPRAKLLLPKFVGGMSGIKRYVREEYEAQYRAKFESQHQTQSPQTNQHEEQDVALGIALNQLIDDTFGADEPATHAGESFASELDRWFGHRDHTMTTKTKSEEVCAWMRNLQGFPRIKMMARDFLAVMATSVPSEQAFSAAGNTVSIRRARLGDDAVSAVSEMQSFLKFNEATAKLG